MRDEQALAMAEREMRPPSGIRVRRPAGNGRTVEALRLNVRR
ncbi:hypothetical protein [Actinocorallia populi]|nr:hypothetical protein [Actinocorallia populi]